MHSSFSSSFPIGFLFLSLKQIYPIHSIHSSWNLFHQLQINFSPRWNRRRSDHGIHYVWNVIKKRKQQRQVRTQIVLPSNETQDRKKKKTEISRSNIFEWGSWADRRKAISTWKKTEEECRMKSSLGIGSECARKSDLFNIIMRLDSTQWTLLSHPCGSSSYCSYVCTQLFCPISSPI